MTSRTERLASIRAAKANPLPFRRALKGKDIPGILHELLSFGTPHGHEKTIAEIVIREVKASGYIPGLDEMGNIMVKVGESETLFSCHMDTVHDEVYPLHLFITTGPRDQDKDFIIAGKKNKENKIVHSVLGADDKVGVFILLFMIREKIPGYYIFHVGEEVGGKGSRFIADNHPDWVKHFKRAIAFDRANYFDVIDNQRGRTCCSKEFSGALCDMLTTLAHEIHGGMAISKTRFRPATGTFTDTASYMDIIPECSNISVGYFNQHSTQEKTDIHWLLRVLLPIIKDVKWEELPTVRDPKEKPTYVSSWPNNGGYTRVVGGPKGMDHKLYRTTLPYMYQSYAEFKLMDSIENFKAWELDNRLKKWCYHHEEIQVKQLNEIIHDRQDLVDELAEKAEELYDMQFMLCELKDRLEKAGQLELLGAELGTIVDEFTEDLQGDAETTLGQQLDAEIKAAIAKDDKKDEKKKPLLAIVKQAETVKLGPQLGGIKTIKAANPYIYFNIDTMRCYCNGEELELHSKKMNKLNRDKLGLMEEGTELWIKHQTSRFLVHVIHGKEKLQCDAKLAKTIAEQTIGDKRTIN